MRKLLLTFSFLLILSVSTKATHVIGGLLTYEHLGNYQYRVQLRLYRDCAPGNFSFPASARIVAYYDGGNQGVESIIPTPPVTQLDPIVDTCIVKVDVCVQEAIYETVMYLPPVEGGYHLLWDMYARNHTIDNLTDPGSVGEGFYTFIPNDTLVVYSIPPIPGAPPSSIPLWLEDFSGLANGTTSDAGATAWTSSPGASSDNFNVANGEFVMDDIDNTGSWTSEWIDISAETCVDLSVNVRERTGNELEDSDYIRFYYDTGTGLIQFPINGNLFNDFTSTVAQAFCVTGDSIRIVIQAANNGNDEEYYFDNIAVSPPAPLDTTIIWCEDFDLANGTTTDAGPTAWTTVPSGTENFFEVTGSSFAANDLDGLSQWYSEWIPVTGDTFYIAAFLSEQGDLESDDYIRLYYSTDDGISYTGFDINGSQSNDFGTDTAYALGIFGADSIQIRIDMDNNSTAETYFLDGICLHTTSDAKIPIDTTHMISGSPNSTPSFVNFPPIYMCAGQPFVFDNSATDIDGDSLVYRPCTPYDNWNSDASNGQSANPPPFDANGNPVIPDISTEYSAGFDAFSPFGPTGTFDLDSLTGILNGEMPAVPIGGSAQYVVGVCVDEYRDDTLINTIKRDFQFNAVYCPPLAQTVINDTAVCDGATIQFPFPLPPTTQGVRWDFGDPTTTADVSTALNPSYTYPDTGTYMVTLIVNEGTPCVDTATALVTITWSRSAFFDDDPGCIGQPITFTDSSYSSNNSNVNGWTWDFGDGNTSTAQNPAHTYAAQGTYNVSLIAASDFGCYDTTIHQVVVDSQVFVTAPPDTSVCATVTSMQLSGSFSGPATGAVWRTLGDGSFSDSLDLNAIYTFGTADVATPVDTIVLLLVSTGQLCNAVIDTMNIEISVAPTVDAGLPDTICINNPTITFAGSFTAPATGVTWATSGSGNFAPSPTIIIPTYTFSASDLTLDSLGFEIRTTPANPSCPDAIDSVFIHIEQAPIVSAGPDDTTCSNNYNVVLAASSPTTHSGLWHNVNGDNSGFSSLTDSNATYTPTATDFVAGFATLVWETTNNGLYCIPETDTMQIFINIPATATAPGNISVCHNNPDFTVTGLTSPNGQSVQWSTSMPGTFAGGNSTSYTVTFQPDQASIVAPDSFQMYFCIPSPGVGCAPECDSLQVKVTPSPVVSACDGCGPFDYEFLCAGNCLDSLKGAFYNQSDFPGSGTTWRMRYILRSTDHPNEGAAISDTTDMKSKYCPSAIETPVLPAQSVEILEFILIPTNIGTCLAEPDTAQLTIYPIPLIDAGVDRELCVNNVSSIALNSTPNYGPTGQSSPPTWDDEGASGTFSPANIEDPTYTFNPVDVVVGNVIELEICIYRQALSNLCPSVCDSLKVTFVPAPTANAGQDQSVCANNPLATVTGDTTSGGSGGALSFSWTNLYGPNGTFSPNSTNLSVDYTPNAGQIDLASNQLPSPPADSTWCLRFEVSDVSSFCSPVADTVCIDATPPPVVEAGPNDTVCDNNRPVTLNGSVTEGATQGVWSGGTGIFLPNASTLTNVGYTPATPDSVTLTLCSTNGAALNNCAEECDSMKIYISPAPTVSAGADDTTCVNNPNVTLNGSFDATVSNGIIWQNYAGTFAPVTDNTNPLGTYQPSAAEISNGNVDLIIRTTGSGLCSEITDTMTLFFDPSPTVDAGNDVNTCVNNPVSSLGGTVTNATGGQWSDPSNSGTFSQPNSLNTTYTYTANGGVPVAGSSVRIYFTSTGNGGCNPVVDSMTIFYTPAPTVSVGPVDTSCANNAQLTLTATMTLSTTGIWSGYNPAGTFVAPGNNTKLTVNYIPSAAEIASGSITLTYTTTDNGNCLPVSDTGTFQILQAPTVSAGPPDTVCIQNLPITLNGTLTQDPRDPSTHGVIWSNIGTAGLFSPTTSLTTDYTPASNQLPTYGSTLPTTSQAVIYTTGGSFCTNVSDTVMVTIMPAPIVDPGSNQTVCTDATSISLNPSDTNVAVGTWSLGGGATGSFNGPQDAYNVNIPTDHNNSPITLVYCGTTPAYSGCNVVCDSIEITFQTAPVATVSAPNNVCTTDFPVSVTAAGSSPGSWSSPSGSFAVPTNLATGYTPPGVGIFEVTWITTPVGSCPSFSASDTITVIPGPVVYAGPNDTLCSDVSCITLNGSITNAGGTGFWNIVAGEDLGTFGNGVATVNPNTYCFHAGNYSNGYVNLVLCNDDLSVCSQVCDTLHIELNPNVIIDAGINRTICGDQDTLQLLGTVQTATGGTWTTTGSIANGPFSNPNILTPVYTWDPNTVAPGDTVGTADSIVVYITSTGNGLCQPVTDSMIIHILPVPVVEAGPNHTICYDETFVTLNGQVYNANQGVWTNNTLGPNNYDNGGVFNSTTAPINYYRTVEDSNGTWMFTLTTQGAGICKDVKDSMYLTVLPAPVATTMNDTSTCADAGSFTLTGTVTNATGGTWTASSTSGSFNGTETTINGAVYTFGPADTNGVIVFKLTTTGNNNCFADSATFILTITPSVVVEAGPSQTFCATKDTIQLTGSVQNAGGGTWSTNNGGSFVSTIDLNTQYIVSSADSLTGSAVIYLDSRLEGQCLPQKDSVIYYFNPVPIVDAGPNDTICADSSGIQLTGTVTNATGGHWTSSSDSGFFLNANLLTSTLVLSANDTMQAIQPLQLCLTSTGNGLCQPVTDCMDLLVTPIPTVTTLGIDTVCADADSISLTSSFTVAGGVAWTTTGTGSISDSSQANTFYTLSNLDTAVHNIRFFATTTQNGQCGAYTDVLDVHITSAPTLNPGPDQTICRDLTKVTMSGTVGFGTGIWSSSDPAGSFSNNSDLSAEYTHNTVNPNAPDSITITLTNTNVGTCKQISDSILLIINPIPIMNAGNADTVCADSARLLLSGTFANTGGGAWSSPTGGNFSPSTTSPGATYIFDSLDYVNGGVTLNWTSTNFGTCNPVTDQISIAITPAPTVNANVNQLVCGDNPNIFVNGSKTVATGSIWSTSGGGTFADSSLLFTKYTPDTSDINNGFVVLTLRTTGNGLCKSVTDNMTLNIDPVPTLVAGFSQTLCASVDTIALNAVFSGADSIIWSTDGFGSFASNTPNSEYYVHPLDSAAGTIRIFARTWDSIPMCKTLYDTMTIVFSPVPTVSITSQATCTNNGEVTLIATYTNCTGVIWSTDASGGGSEFSGISLDTTIYTPLPADVPGTANITVITVGSGGCAPAEDIDTLDIGLRADPVVTPGADQVICADAGTVTIGADASIINPTGALSWTSSSGGSYTDNSLLSTIYTINATDITNGQVVHQLCTENNGICPQICNTVTTFITPAPTVDAGPNVLICADEDTICFSGATFTTSTGVVWSSAGTGTFEDSSKLNPCYRPTPADDDADSVKFLLCTTGNGKCLQHCDSTFLIVDSIPVISMLSADTVCADIAIELDETIYGTRGPQPGYALSATVANATGGTWTYTGSPDSVVYVNSDMLDLTYYSSLTDTTTGVVGFEFCATQGIGRCNVYCDSFYLNYLPRPVLSIADSAICSSDDSVMVGALLSNAGGVKWTTGGDGTFNNDVADTTYYQFGTNDKIGQTVFLYAVTTGVGSCFPIYDTLIVNYTDPYFVTAGPDQTVCSDTSLIQLDAGYNDPIVDSVIWRSLGTGGSFSNINDSSATYTLSATDIAAGSVRLVITTAVGDLCPELKDTMRIIIYPAPIVTANALNACAETDTIAVTGSIIDTAGAVGTGFWSSDGDGTWDPDNVTLITNYIRGTGDSTTGTFLLTLTADPYGQCHTVFDTLRIDLIPVPQVIVSDTVICKDADSIRLSAYVFADTNATLTWSGGNGSFSMGDVSPGVDNIFKNDSSFMTYYFDPSDTVGVDSMVVHITNDGGSCSPVTDSIIIRFNPVPVVIAASDAACSVFDTVNLIGTVLNADSGRWSHLGAGLFLRDRDSLLNEYEPTVADTTDPASDCVDFILTSRANRGCKAYSDTTRICFTTPPAIDAGLNDTICADVSFFPLNGTIDTTASSGGVWTPSVSGGSFSMDSTDLNANYTYPTSVISPTNDTTIAMILTSTGNGLCPAVSDTVYLTVTHPLLTTFSDTITVCGDTSAIPVSVLTNDVVDNLIWRNVSGTGTFADSTADTTTYTISSADSTAGFATISYTAYDVANCKPVTDTIIIIITPVPTVDAGAGEICVNSAIVQLNGSITHNGVSTPNDGVWSSTGDGTFTVGLNGVVKSLYTRGVNDTIGATIDLCLQTKNDGLCKTYQDCMTLNIIPTPRAEAGPALNICGSATFATLRGVITTDSSVWITRGTGTFADSTSDTTTYAYSSADSLAGCVTLVLQTTFDNRGCSPGVDSTVLCIRDEPIINAGIPDTACYESTPGVPGSIVLSGSFQYANGIEWTSSNGNSTRFDPGITSTSPTYYFVNADSCGPIMFYLSSTGTGSCNPVTDSVEIYVRCVPELTDNADTTVCGDADSVSVCVTLTNATGVSWATGGDGTFNDSTLLCPKYLPGTQDVLDSVVLLTPSTTGNEQCQTYKESFRMYFTEIPTLDAGLPQNVCSSAGNNIFLSPTVTVANAFAWTTDIGSGSFVDSSVLNAVYIPGPTDSAVTVNMILTVSDTVTGCKSYVDSVAIIFEPAVVVSAGGPLDTVCEDIGILNLDGSVLVATGGLWSTLNGDPTRFNPIPPNRDSVQYTLSAADKTNGSVSFVLESTGGGNCLTVFDTITYIINPAPIVSAGMNDTICADAVVYGLTGGITVTGTGYWASTGDGSWSPDSLSLITDYILGTGDANVLVGSTNSVTLVLESTNNGLCNPATDILQLEITEVPIVYAGADRSVCQDKSSISFVSPIKDAIIFGATSTGVWSTTNGTGSFNDTTFAGMTTYTMSTADTAFGTSGDSLCFVLTSTDNGLCNPVTDTMYVHVLPRPRVSVNNTPGLVNDTISICADQDTVMLVGTVTNSPTQLWSSIPFEVSAQNAFDNPIGLTPIFTVPVSLRPIPGALLNKYIGVTLQTIGNSNGCSEVSDALIIEITPEPLVNIIEPDSVCADVDSVMLDGTYSTNISSGVVWSSGDATSSFNTTTSLPTWYVPGTTDRAFGLALLSLTTTGSGQCSEVEDNLNMYITPRPELYAGPDIVICGDVDTLYLTGATTNPVVKAVRWSTIEGNNTNFDDRTSLRTAYYVAGDVPAIGSTISNFMTFILETTDVGDCKNISDTLLVEIQPRPVVTLATADICADLSGLEVTSTVINSTGILWSSSDGIFSQANLANTNFTPDTSIKPGVATVTVCSNGSGTCREVCDSMDIVITDLPDPDAGPSQTVCRNTPASLIGADNLGTGVTFTWYDNTGATIGSGFSINSPLVTTANTMFAFGIIDNNGCEQRDTMYINPVDPPSFNMPSPYCYEDNVVLSSGLNQTEYSNIPITLRGEFQWFYEGAPVSPGNDTTFSNVSGPGRYWISWISGTCRASDSTTVAPLPVVEGIDLSVCAFDTDIPLNATSGFVSYSWAEVGGLGQTGSTNPFIVNAIGSDTVDQVFVVTVTDTLGCQGEDLVYLYEYARPLLNIDPGLTCSGTEATLIGTPSNDSLIGNTDSAIYTWVYEGNSGGTAGSTWSGLGLDTSSHSWTGLLDSGWYQLTYGIDECVVSDSVFLPFHPLPIPNAQDSAIFCAESDGSTILDGGPSTGSYNWYDENMAELGITDQFAEVFSEMKYYVDVIDSNGCISRDSIDVEERCPPRCHVPTAFSPNGQPCDPTCTEDDNVTCPDNCFYVFCKHQTNFKLTIFNRWGEIIFYSTNKDDLWDGTYLGVDMPSGVYPWTMEYDAAEDAFKRPKYISGKVLIVR